MKKPEPINLKKDIKEKLELINMTMDRFLARKDDYPKEIHKAIRHSIFAGGKRIRPYLMLLTYQLFKNSITEEILIPASAIEILHTYTLIHDDLPEIDNDELRRGKKTCHVVFGSDIALLAGDTLLIEAVNMLCATPISASRRLKLIRDLTIVAGERGLIAGQMQDILSEGETCDKKTLEFIHLNKTAKLIRLCTRWGAFLAEASKEDVHKMDEFGGKLGLAFQIVDDILDVEGTSASMGKTIGKDAKEQKATYPAIFGMPKSKELADKYTSEALAMLEGYKENAAFLVELTKYLLERKK